MKTNPFPRAFVACFVALTLAASDALGAGARSTPLSAAFRPVAPALGSLLRQAIKPGMPGNVELRNAVDPEIARSLQAIDRLDLGQENHRAVLGALAQHLPEGFELRLAAYFDRPSSGEARAIGDVMSSAYQFGAQAVEREASARVRELLESASQGMSSADEFEAAARELDQFDLYGSRLWTMTNHLRATALAYRNRKAVTSAEETAKKLLADHYAEEEPPAPGAASAAAPPQLESSTEKTAQVTADQLVEFVKAALKDARRLEIVKSADGVDLREYSETKKWFTVLRVFPAMKDGKFQLAVHDDRWLDVRAALAANGLLMETKVRDDGQFGLTLVEPVLLSVDEAKWRAAQINGMFNWSDDLKVLRSRVEALNSPEARAAGLAELDKLAGMKNEAHEKTSVRGFITWLLKTPWNRKTRDRLDLVRARKLLDKNQFGLERVKERVLEFLAVRKRKGDLKGAIICFTGPPGVGKTAIAKTIAQALGRTFVRISLGGVYDTTELRGHNRTYVSSQPGSIIRQMAAAGTSNPVMLLDEIDKIGQSSNHGSVEAALLEILDPAQNNTFRDHYLDLPYDLSGVLFIATANELDKISQPLRDRMEIIEFPSYTPIEKLEIAERHLVPISREENGVKPEEATLTRSALERIIEDYTVESGVRLLRQKIDELFRKIVALVEGGGKAPRTIEERDVEDLLGPATFGARAVIENGVGLATGLAVNAYGGTTINVEVVTNKGSGKVSLRHQFKDMASDSAQNAVAYVRTVAEALGIKDESFNRLDIDIAFTPAMQVDGPSAGTAMATAIASRLSGRPIRKGIAMTGELTLTGRVLKIGGLREKVMAAYRAGMYAVLYPVANQRDAERIPEEIRRKIKLIPVSTAEEVFQHALETGAPPPPSGDEPASVAQN